MKQLQFIYTALAIYLSNYGYSQSVLENIRSEYYRLNSGNVLLEPVSISNTDYFLEKGKVKKVKVRDNMGINEYYYKYNPDYGTYKVFFIYFLPDKKSNLTESRLYLNENEQVFLYKENAEEKSFFDANFYSNQLILKSLNALNKFSRIFFESRDEYGQEKLFVDSLFQLIEESKLTEIDTAQKTYNEEESQSFDEGKSVFINSVNAIVKTIELHGNNHGSKKVIEYFHDGKVILRTSESEYYINGFQYSVDREYYTRERFEQVMFRKEGYKNYGAKLESTNALLSFRLDNIEPCIEIKKRR